MRSKFLSLGNLVLFDFALSRAQNARSKLSLNAINFLRSIKMGCSTSKVEVSSSGSVKTTEEYVEGILCKETDLNENEMKQFDLDEGKVLLVKQNGKISALGPKCTHYGAPLVHGALGDGRVRCQWHGACYSLATGDIEDYPGLDSLPCHQVQIENGNVKVRAKKSELESNKRIKSMAKRDRNNKESIVVIGGGPSGATCVEVLRQEGFTGRIVLVCREDYLPYDRVKVSKAMDFDIEKCQFRTDQFYEDHGIEVLKGVAADRIVPACRTVELSNGDCLVYNKLYIATGSDAKKVNVPGKDLKNVLVLRDYEHSKYTNGILNKEKEVVVLGNSFISLEAANYCLNKVKKVTVVSRSEFPFMRMVGKVIGAAVKKLFEEKGVEFITNNNIKMCCDDGQGYVSSVELLDGTILKADIVIMGTGSKLATDFLKDSGIAIREDGSIETDEYLRTNIDNIFVGGDIAYAPVFSHDNMKATIGHYPLAHYHGRIAALNMIGKKTELQSVPYFWTMLFGKGLRYAGHGDFNDIIIHGDVTGFKFVAFLLKDEEVVAAASIGMDPVVSEFAEMLAQNRKLYKKDLCEDPLAWRKKVVL